MKSRYFAVLFTAMIMSVGMILPTYVAAQDLDNMGKDFILGFLRNNTGGSTCELHLTGETETDVTVQYPYNSPTTDTTVTVVPGSITIVPLPTAVGDNWSFGTVMDNTVHAFAGDEFVCYMVNRDAATSDAALGLPVDVMNTEYIVTTYSGSNLNSGGGGEFAVVAAYANTEVTITPSQNLSSGQSAGVPFTVTLQTGEGFVSGVLNTYGAIADLSGTTISATRPVGVTSGNLCANVPPDTYACDHIFEVSQSTQTWGTRILCANLPNRPSGSVYRVYASEDNTAVTLDGAPLATLNRGEFHETDMIDGNHIFEANQPVFLVQFMPSQDSPGATLGDPAMGNICPAEQFMKGYTFSTVGGGQFDEDYLTIITHSNDVGAVTLDGAPIAAADFTQIGTSDWYSAVLPLAEGTHSTYSPDTTHGITIEGYGTYDSYIFPGGALFAPIPDTLGDTIPPVCDLEYDGCVAYGSAEDPGPEATGIHSVVLETGSVNLLLEVDPAFVPGDLTVSYTVSLIDDQQPGSGTVTVRDLEGNKCSSPVDLDCGGSQDCYPDLDPPELVVEPCAEQTLSSTRFFLEVLNWNQFPDDLFQPAPDLPPCGDADPASRTWVDIYDQDDNYIYGFCQLGDNEELNDMWFSISGGIWPDSVYIVIWDRECDIMYTSNKAPIENIEFPPFIYCPSQELSASIDSPGEACVDLLMSHPGTVDAGDATWADNELCFYASASGTYEFNVVAENDCGTDECTVVVNVTVGGGPIPTPEWIVVYCGEPTFNGMPLVEGDIIRAYDPDGVVCGMDEVRADGSFGFMPIYRDDIYTDDVDEGAEPGDVINFSINGEMVYTDPVITWTANGAILQLCNFSTCKNIQLHEGWNLVSWNVMYSASTEDFLADQFGDNIECLDVILSFDQVALTYDPDLPDFSTLEKVDYYHGYWIRVSCDTELEICGQPIPAWEGIPIYAGWNLVSYWPHETMTVEDGFASILDHLLVAEGFDGGALTWLPDTPDFNTLTDLSECFGYWANVDADGMLCYDGWCEEGSPPSSRYGYGSGSVLVSDVVPSNNWISIYGSNITVDGQAVREGAVIEARTAGGDLCGREVYSGGMLVFTPVYGYDESSDVTAGYPRSGESVYIYVDGDLVYPELAWEDMGSRSELSTLSTKQIGDTLILPGDYGLEQNYPNPFNPTTVIPYSIQKAGHVELSVFNLLGQKVTTLVDDYKEAGEYDAVWNGADESGKTVSSGIYFYKLRTGDFIEVKKMMLMK
jgi:hypothetical protein